MKKIKVCCLLIVLGLFFALDKVNAECDNKSQLEINTASSNITMNYSLETLTIDTEGNIHPEIEPKDVELSEMGEYSLIDRAVININNVSDKVYVVFHSNDDNVNQEYHYKDLQNGSLTYEVPDLDNIRNYTLTVYSDVSECSNQELRTINLTTPMYNSLSDQIACENNNAYYCQKYITTPIDEEGLDLDVNDVNDGNNSNLEKENNENYMLFTLGIIVIVVIIIAIIIMIAKNKQRKDNEIKNIGGN